MKKDILLVGFPNKQFNKLKKELLGTYKVYQYKPDEKQKPQLIIINWKTAELCNELELLKQNKYFADIPFLLFTPYKENLILQCFKNGISDFLDETLAAEMNKAKISAWLKCRIRNKKESSSKIKIGNLQINFKKRKVTRKGNEIDLTKIEYDILSLLTQERSKIFSREEIYDKIWGSDVIVGERTLDVHMNNLRKKIGKNKIKTKKGIGFGINPEI